MPGYATVVPRNRLIARLPEEARHELLSHCEQIELGFGDVLCDAGDVIRHVYFPIDSILCLILPTECCPELEIGLVGCEGMLGISVALGISTGLHRGLVQSPGLAWRIDSAAFRSVSQQSPALKRSMERYFVAFMHQLAQTAACMRFHDVEARLARWLLMTHDRARGGELHITQEFVARMLGVRRVGVTQAARTLRQRNLITYSRGRIRILDRPGLEQSACGCYRVITRAYDRLLSDPASEALKAGMSIAAGGAIHTAAK